LSSGGGKRKDHPPGEGGGKCRVARGRKTNLSLGTGSSSPQKETPRQAATRREESPLQREEKREALLYHIGKEGGRKELILPILLTKEAEASSKKKGGEGREYPLFVEVVDKEECPS